MEEILKQIEGMIEHVTSMKVSEDTDILLAELNDVHAKLSAQQNVEQTPLSEADMLEIISEIISE